MIQSIEISGIEYEVNETTQRYVIKQIGRLDRYLPRHARKTVSASIKLKQIDKPNGNKYEAEVTLTLPDKTIVAKDTTVNMLAAVDIVEMKLINQLHEYKDAALPRVGRRKFIKRFRRPLPGEVNIE